MRTFSGIEEVAAAVGTTVGVSPWVTIDQLRIDAFAAVTGDAQWIHVDRRRATTGRFGGTIAHGFLTLALVSSFAFSTYRLDRIEAAVNYGTDRVRFPAPVLVGSRLRGHVEFARLVETPRGQLLTSTITVEIDGGARPACVADVLTLLIAP